MGNKVNKPAKLKIRKGDLVKVIAGDSKGQQGKIQEVLVEKNRVIIEGVNLVSKHTKPSAATPNGSTPFWVAGSIEGSTGITAESTSESVSETHALDICTPSCYERFCRSECVR